MWNEKDNVYAKDLSHHILLKNKDGSDRTGAIYSPDAYSDYSTLGVVIEANSKANKDGILPEDVINRQTDLFGSPYVLSIGIPTNGNYQLYVRVFDSEDDWIDDDTCGIQAIIPIAVNGEDDVSVGKIQFSNILVSAIETNYENLEITKKIMSDAVASRNNSDIQSDQNSKDDIENISKTEYLSPRKQLESGVPVDKIQCKDGLILAKNAHNGDPMCLKPKSFAKLKERNLIQ